MDLKKVALNDIHEELGAKMVAFAGFNMPVRYSSDKEEHLCVREKVGIFDVSHMGEFRVKGKQALPLIQKVFSNDAAKLVDGQAMYGYLPNEKGGVVDDLLVYRFNEEDYMLVVNAANIEKDWQWITKHNENYQADLQNVSEEISLFAVQGPKATEALQSLTDINLADMKFYTFAVGEFAGASEVIVSATGYTGAGGFELYVPNEAAANIWKAIMEAGSEVGIQPIGLGARDTLRLEKGYCLYGNDISDESSPLEAGLGWVTKFTKDFVNSAALKAQKEEGLKKRLVAFKMLDRGIPRQHYTITDGQGNAIGKVTSGSLSPVLNIGIGLGYVPNEFAKAGTSIFIQVRQKELKAEVVKLPFV